MLTKDQAQTIARKLDDTFLFPNVIGEGNKVVTPARGQMTAKVGEHVTNGARRFQVNVTFPDHTEAPFTISNKSDARVPA